MKKRIHREWSNQERIFLRKHYATKGSKWCAAQLGVKPHIVSCMANHMGLTVNVGVLREIKSTAMQKAWVARSKNNRCLIKASKPKQPAGFTVQQKAAAFDAIFKDFEVSVIKVRLLEARVKKLEEALIRGKEGRA